MPSGTLFSARSRLWVSFSLSFALPGRVEDENWSPRGPGGPRKSSKIDSKSLSIPIGGLRRAGGYPPDACRTPRVHIYAYLCMYLYVCMHIHAYLCMYLCLFMHIHAYVCIFQACFMHMYAYSCIFVYIHAYASFSGNTYYWTQSESFINHYWKASTYIW